MLERKRKTKTPCPECFLHLSLCICELFTAIETKSRLSLIIHVKELKRTTNTGRLALKVLKNSEMKIRGQSKEALDLSSLISEDYQSVLFFPSDQAVELTPTYAQSFSKPIHLIVPDGNWRQASKVSIRHAELKNIPRVKISTKNTATEHLRAETTEEGMATLEAIAKAFRIIESEESFQVLNKIYQAKLKNTLIGRGQKL